jgi:hypothetical protein
MSDSKAVLNCNPTYPTNVHERVTVGMLYGSCVITDVNPCIERTFAPDQFIAYAPGSTMTIDDVFAAHDVRAIAGIAGQAARAEPQFTWNAHFDEILSVAAA